MRYRMIERCREDFPIRMMCRSLKVSPSGYYDWRGRVPSRRVQENERLMERIRRVHEASDGVMGNRRIWAELRYEGARCGANRMAHLMRTHRLRGIPQRKPWKQKACGD